jgi:streptomycin 6-kinase
MDVEVDAARLKAVARQVAAEWGEAELGEPYALSHYSFVAPAGSEAVLKVTPPGDDESDEEGDALELWEGDGAVRLLRRDRARRAMLLERARPGDDISGLPEDEATAVAIETGQRLWRPAGNPFRWIGDHVPRWLEQAESSLGSGDDLMRLGPRLYESIEPKRSTLIHGDLHHHNILDAGSRYVAIDPKPMLGEPEFDVPSFLWNPLGSVMTEETTERRLAAFAAAGLDEARMRAWTVIRGAYLLDDREERELVAALA